MPNTFITKLVGFTSVVTAMTLSLLIGIGSRTDAFQGYNVVITTDPVTESNFLANTTTYFEAKLVPNPLIANTYQLNLYGLNPSFNAPPTTLQDALSLGSTVYVYGFANGMTYQNKVSENLTSGMIELCGNATNFNLIQATTATFNLATCQDVLSNLIDEFFNIDLSTPTPIPTVAP